MNLHNMPNSKYCVGIVEAWEEQGYLYICSELCERGNLNDYILQELGLGNKRKKKAKKNITFCTEEDDDDEEEEQKDDSEIETPFAYHDASESDIEMDGGDRSNDFMNQQPSDCGRDSRLFASSFEAMPNQLVVKRGNSIISEMSSQSITSFGHKDFSLLPEKEVWRIFYDMARSIQHVHEKGFIHLDISPGNFFVAKDRTVKLGDFGKAV